MEPAGGQAAGRAAGTSRRVVWMLDSLRAGGAERLALRFAAAAPAPWEVHLVALQPPPGMAPGAGREARAGLEAAAADGGGGAGGADGARGARAALAALWGGEIGGLGERLHCFGMRHLRDLATLRAVARRVGEIDPELIHTHLRYAGLWGGWIAGRQGRGWVATLHSLPQRERGWAQRAAAAWERRRLGAADRVVFVSAAQRAAWRAAGRGGRRADAAGGAAAGMAREAEAGREAAGWARGWRGCVLANGVPAVGAWSEAERARARRARGAEAGMCVFLTVAVVRGLKGWREWLAAAGLVAAERPEARFWWVGGGPELGELERAAAASGLGERVRVWGPRTDVADWLRAADVFWFPSREEALPTAVIEALAAGLPVVAADVPAVAEALGECGERVGVGDAAGLARAALGWLERGEAARRAEGERGRRRFERWYGHRGWQDRLLALYGEIARERGEPGSGVFRARRTDGL